MRWILFAVMVLALAPLSPPARAAFGDCASAAYRASFDPRLADIEYDCVERLSIPVNTRSGGRRIRIVHDRMADWIVSSGELAEFDRGARAAAAAIGRLGDIDLEDVTILLADDFPPREDADSFSNIAAWTEFDRDGECRIAVYLVGPASRPAFAAWLIAHEIFHCVQVANLSAEQMATGSIGVGGGGDWWIEGSATWFAALAVPAPAILPDLVAEFDSASPTTPLDEMAYAAAPFFLWLGVDSSPPGVMRFLQSMAGDRAAAAQHAAMARALTQDDWLRFAQSYLDGEIRHPLGTPLSFEPQAGASWRWAATRTETTPLPPFVLVRGAAAFECGRWRNAVTPSERHRARRVGEREWGTLPVELDATSGGGEFQVVAMNASASNERLVIHGRMDAGCGTCADIVERDACLVGEWQMTGGGPVEWMRSRGVPGAYSTSNATVTFRRDGTYLTGVLEGAVGAEQRGVSTHGGMAAQAGGRWSARGGVLSMCNDMQANSGRIITSGPDATVRTDFGSLPTRSSQVRYVCSEGALSTEMDMPRGAGTMSTQYSRIGR